MRVEENLAGTIEIEGKRRHCQTNEDVENVERELLFAKKRRIDPIGDQTAAQTNVQTQFQEQS